MADTGSHYNNPKTYYSKCNGNRKAKSHSSSHYVKEEKYLGILNIFNNVITLILLNFNKK